MSDTYETLIVERRGAAALITLNRPDVLNAISIQMRCELRGALEKFRDAHDVHVVILTGAGDKAFSAGMDLAEFRKLTEKMTLHELRRFRWREHEGITDFDKPIIAAVNGLAIGGGSELALLCDFILAAQTATFGFAEVKRGLMPGNGATQRLPRRIGKSKALELMLTGRTINADEALALGMVDQVVAPDQLLNQALALGEEIASNAPLAVRSIKAAVTRGADMPLQEGLELERDLAVFLYSTEDAQEGPRAFLEKRKPSWLGR